MIACKVIEPGMADEGYRAVRIEVFVREQNIPIEKEFDEWDAAAWHIVLLEDGVPVATGRYLCTGENEYKLGRIAVVKQKRGTGLGRQVVEAMMDGAKAIGAEVLWLSAQVQAIGFYEKLGFSVCDGVHDECGVPHRNMIFEKLSQNYSRFSS